MMVKLFYPPVREWFMEHHFKEFCIFENETFKNSTQSPFNLALEIRFRDYFDQFNYPIELIDGEICINMPESELTYINLKYT